MKKYILIAFIACNTTINTKIKPENFSPQVAAIAKDFNDCQRKIDSLDSQSSICARAFLEKLAKHKNPNASIINAAVTTISTLFFLLTTYAVESSFNNNTARGLGVLIAIAYYFIKEYHIHRIDNDFNKLEKELRSQIPSSQINTTWAEHFISFIKEIDTPETRRSKKNKK